jgi:DNA-binding transcriptional MerR regulator
MAAMTTSGRGLTPAAAAERCGVSIDTLRYYEREGLIGPVARSVGGHRSYDEADLFWIGLVTCLREAGLGIADLREFTALLRSDGEPEDRVTFLLRHRRELEERAARIRTAIEVLGDKIDYYSAEERAGSAQQGTTAPTQA